MSLPGQRQLSSPQSSWQFSLLTLLVTMTWVAVACMALRTPGPLWSLIFSSSATLALLVAILAIVYRTGRTRAFAIGFLTFGLGFNIVVVLEQLREGTSGGHQMPTTSVAASLFHLIHGDDSQLMTVVPTTTVLPAPPLSPPPMVAAPSPYVVSPSVAYSPLPPSGSAPVATLSFFSSTIRGSDSFEYFLDNVHSLLVVALGVLGGITAQILNATRRENSDARA